MENRVQVVDLGPLLPFPGAPRPVAEELSGSPFFPSRKEYVLSAQSLRDYLQTLSVLGRRHCGTATFDMYQYDLKRGATFGTSYLGCHGPFG